MDRTRANPWAVLLVLCMGFFMILLDTTIVNIAIPSIVDALKASLDQILWVLNAYILVYAVLLITAGRLGDLFGQRNMFALGMAIFVASSATAGLTQSVEGLIAARVSQGVGGALLTPQTLAIITTIFPPDRRGAAFGIWGAVAGVAAVIGPTLGGFIVTNASWRWIFYVNVPIGVATLIATFVVIPDLRTGRRHRLDLLGVALSSLGLFLVVFGLIEGERYNWGTILGPITIAEVIGLGIVLLILFGYWERRSPEPLVPLSLFSDRNYLIMNWLSVVLSFGMLGLFFPITIYLQSALGLSALTAGLTVAPMSLTAMLVAPFSGRLSDRFGGKYILLFGLITFAAGMALVDWQAAPGDTASTFLLPFVVAGLGQGFIFAPLSAVAMRNIRPAMAGAASGVLNTTRQLGGVIGSSAVGALLQGNLSSALQQRAVADASQLPPQFRASFVRGFAQAVSGNLDVGPTQQGGFHLPASIPPQVAAEIGSLIHNVFATGFVDAMRPTLVLPIAVILVGSISCLFIERQLRATPEPARAKALKALLVCAIGYMLIERQGREAPEPQRSEVLVGE